MLVRAQAMQLTWGCGVLLLVVSEIYQNDQNGILSDQQAGTVGRLADSDRS
jgi:hypothetical protein